MKHILHEVLGVLLTIKLLRIETTASAALILVYNILGIVGQQQ
jgi:hypothetical protein